MTIKHLLSTGLALGALSFASAAQAANAKICFEAEKPAALNGPLKKRIVGANPKYSGSGFIEIPWDQNKTKGIGSATYKFNVKTAGMYSVWARTFWANGCGNSIGVSVNGGPLAVLGEDGSYDAWKWRGAGAARVRLKAGINTLVLKNTETGVRVDQFFLCQDADYEPTGIRKITK